MSHSINIGRFKVQTVSQNANINSGGAFQNSHTSNITMIGGNFSFGDSCINSFTTINCGNITISNEDSAQDS
jgi:Spore germination protein gerPA/gerPF